LSCAIAHFHAQGYTIIGITNQGSVAMGYKSFIAGKTNQKSVYMLAIAQKTNKQQKPLLFSLCGR
jgi:hypothetical protein